MNVRGALPCQLTSYSTLKDIYCIISFFSPATSRTHTRMHTYTHVRSHMRERVSMGGFHPYLSLFATYVLRDWLYSFCIAPLIRMLLNLRYDACLRRLSGNFNRRYMHSRTGEITFWCTQGVPRTRGHRPRVKMCLGGG